MMIIRVPPIHYQAQSWRQPLQPPSPDYGNDTEYYEVAPIVEKCLYTIYWWPRASQQFDLAGDVVWGEILRDIAAGEYVAALAMP